MSDITAEDSERIELLEIVSSSKIGLKILSKEQLERLHRLVEGKDYSHDVEALISKIELLKKINNRLYDLGEDRVILWEKKLGFYQSVFHSESGINCELKIFNFENNVAKNSSLKQWTICMNLFVAIAFILNNHNISW